MRRLFTWCVPLFVLCLAPLVARAQNTGQADLDAAADQQITAETLGDLERVIKLAEIALDKGLEPGQQDFAKKLLAATYYQHANRTTEAIFARRRPDRNWRNNRDQSLKDLAKAKQYDPTLPDIYLLEGRLHAELPMGDEKAGVAAVSEAISLLKLRDDPKQLAKAYIQRGRYVDDVERKLADFEAAAQADPGNLEAGQGLAGLYIQQGDKEKAVATLQKLVERDPDNPGLLEVLADTLTTLKKFDDALRYCDDLVKQAPQHPTGYVLRARVRVMKEDIAGAIKDLDQAIDLDKENIQALLMRSTLHASQGHEDQAKADNDRLLKIAPDLPQAIYQRSLIAASKKRWGDAIADMQMLLQTDPTNPDYRTRLAALYVADSRPRKAIELLTTVLESIRDEGDPEQREQKAEALRSRGDALLSVGKHAEALLDYEESLKIEPDDTHVLNNYAWVLATSPDDGVRNASRSIELGLRACELTKYEKPHIISTLAAGYAEKGDWETAIKWSSKAAEMGAREQEIDDQLKKELESYQQKKPWREKQEVEENTKPLGRTKSDLET